MDSVSMAPENEITQMADEEHSYQNVDHQPLLLEMPSQEPSTVAGDNPSKWDIFMEDVESGDEILGESKLFDSLAKIFKALVYVVTFLVLLFSAVISKSSLLLMASMMTKGRKFDLCRQNLEISRDKSYKLVLTTEERNGWIWCTIFALTLPEILTFIKCIRICIFKSHSKPKLMTTLVVAIAEALHVIGIVLLVFSVFPYLDIAEGITITNAMCMIPSILSLISRFKKKEELDIRNHSTTIGMAWDMLSIIFQIIGILLWAYFRPNISERNQKLPSLSFAALFVSFGWWENFIDKRSLLLKTLVKVKKDMQNSRYIVYALVSALKIALMISTTFAFLHFSGEDLSVFLKIQNSFTSQHLTMYWLPKTIGTIPDKMKPTQQEIQLNLKSSSLGPIIVLVVHAASSYISYSCAKFSCKIGIQQFSFALPLCLAVPVTLGVMTALCGLSRSTDQCAFTSFSRYIFWSCPEGQFMEDFFILKYGWVWILWILSQTRTSIHIWKPTNERLASMQKLFVNPFYCSVLIDQSLAFNRRKDVNESPKIKPSNEEKNEDNDFADNYYQRISELSVQRIYTCATMWHETSDEMEELLKSVIRLDEDQSARKNAQIYLNVQDPDFYVLENHIFFDDAFVASDVEDNEYVMNDFVKTLISVVDKATSKVHETHIKLPPPQKVPTPYGGRLVWTLPGGNLLIAHLKNKELIRHKKRWSQVMYMYYLMGHNLMELSIPVDQKNDIAENTYILALDGDTNFQPKAVLLLVDLMRKNKSLGAACGRIHPVGTGVMAYYQKFEYAIGHWMQKATEHMIGCVLCSPGCFSLFRVKALMDDNVVKRYTAKSKEALDYIQFDQGEDRWLCTLLLQKGYRVEYSAASDAYTHCPETFSEFYTQRRRWAPSTLANVLDLLVHYRTTVACNDSISLPYIVYQTILTVGTILGPGTIFLMLVGAMNQAIGISNIQSFVANLVPLTMFILICFWAANNTQIMVAQILSAIYALLMMAVLVAICLQLLEDGMGSPSAIFLAAMTLSITIAALLHPQEFWCVVHGLIYFLSIPSMYLFLTLYSLTNLHVVSWGTREVPAKPNIQEQKKQNSAAETKTPKSVMGWIEGLGIISQVEEEGSITFGLANLFRCMCCTYPKPREDHNVLHRIQEELELINFHIDEQLPKMCSNGIRRKSLIHACEYKTLNPVIEENEDQEKTAALTDDLNGRITPTNNDETQNLTYNKPNPNMHWLADEVLEDSPIQFISENETTFWKELIDRYLYPLVDNQENKMRIATQLQELRNKVTFGVLMGNSLFVLIVFLLQMKKDTLYVNWPIGAKMNITYIATINEVSIEADYLKLEPVNLVMAAFFSAILLVQFLAMIMHRWETVSHILATTELNFFSKKIENFSGDENLNRNAVDIAHVLQKLKDDTSQDNATEKRPESRNTVRKLEDRFQGKKLEFKSLDDAFKERYEILSENVLPSTPVFQRLRRFSKNYETIEALKRRASNHISASRNTTPLSSRRNYEHMNGTFGSARSSIQSLSSFISTPMLSQMRRERQENDRNSWSTSRNSSIKIKSDRMSEHL